MLRRRPSLIAFDLDGTLVDSAPDLAWSVDAMRARLGLPPVGEAIVRGWIGHGMAMLVKRALTNQREPDHEPPDFDRGLTLFREIYGEHLCVGSRLYEGVSECLHQLTEGGYRLACITNKPERFTRPLLEQLGIDLYFEMIVGGDRFAHSKPHPQPLIEVAEWADLAPQACLMVGDSSVDAQAAHAAGYALAMVSYGYHGDADPVGLVPDALFDTLADLPEWLRSLPREPAGQFSALQ